MSVCFCIKFRRTGNDFGGWAASPGTYLAAERAGHPFCESLSVAGVEWLLVKKWPSKLGIEKRRRHALDAFQHIALTLSFIIQ